MGGEGWSSRPGTPGRPARLPSIWRCGWL